MAKHRMALCVGSTCFMLSFLIAPLPPAYTQLSAMKMTKTFGADIKNHPIDFHKFSCETLKGMSASDCVKVQFPGVFCVECESNQNDMFIDTSKSDPPSYPIHPISVPWNCGFLSTGFCRMDEEGNKYCALELTTTHCGTVDEFWNQ